MDLKIHLNSSLPAGTSITLSPSSQPWKLYKTDVTTYDGLNTYLIQNINTGSYLAFNVDTGAINYWKRAETNTWKKTWVIGDKPYSTIAPKPSIETSMVLNSYVCINGTNQNVLRTYTNVGINFVDGTYYFDRTYYDLCYNKSTEIYAIYNTDDHTYLTEKNGKIATTKYASESQWKLWLKHSSADYFFTYYLIQNSDSGNYININVNTGDIVMKNGAESTDEIESRVVIQTTRYYVPTAAPTTAAPTTAAPTTAAPTTAAPQNSYYGIYRYINIGINEKALMMPVVRAVSAEAAQAAFESNMANYQKYYYKPASSDDYSESKMANYDWMKSKGNYNYAPSWSGGTLDGVIVKWQQVPS